MSFTFIYGIAGNGLCPFEQALQDKEEGDKSELYRTDSEAPDFFGHLFVTAAPGAWSTDNARRRFLCKLAITTVKDADNREVVQSLAKAASGCGGSCGCGCS